MWKSRDFSAFQILREIKFGNFEVSKTDIFTFLAAQNVEHLRIFNILRLHLLSPKIVLFEFTLNLSRTKLFFPHFVYHSLEICLPLGFYVKSDFGIAEVSKIANLIVWRLWSQVSMNFFGNFWGLKFAKTKFKASETAEKAVFNSLNVQQWLHVKSEW